MEYIGAVFQICFKRYQRLSSPALQVENIGAIFKSVSNSVSVYQVLLLLGSGAAIIFLRRLHMLI